MESTLTSAREVTFRRQDAMRMKRRGNSDVDRVFANAGGFDSAGRIDQGQYLTEVAYSHNRGEPHAACRPIAQRLASSPFHVASIIKSDTSKGFHPAPKAGRRRLSLEEMARLPVSVRHRLNLPTTQRVGEFVKSVKAMHSAAVRVDILEQHPALDILSNPNPRFNGHTLMVDSVISLMFTGRLYWWVTKAQNRPYNLWYVPAHRVEESPGNVMLDQPYLLRPANSYGAEHIKIPAKAMIYAYLPDPADPMKALAPVQACMQNVRVGEAIVTCQEQTFNNGLFPGLAFITGDIIGPDGKSMGKAQLERHQINELMVRMEQFHKGAMKFYKPLILDRVIDDVKFLTNKPHEMAFTESYNENKKAVWSSIGTPPVVAGNTEDANRATALVADESFSKNVVNPLGTLFTHIANDNLLPLFSDDGEQLIMWLEESISADRDQDLKEITLLSSKRGMTVDEVRTEFGYAPLPNGKGAVLVSSATDIFEPLDDSDDDIVQYREDLMEDQAAAGKPAAVEGKPRPPRQNPPPSADDTATGKDFAVKDWGSAWLKVHGRQEASLQKTVEKFLRAQVNYAVSQIRMGITDPDLVFNPREWDKGLIRSVAPHLLRSAITGALTTLRSSKGLLPEFTKDDSESDSVLMEIPPDVMLRIRQGIDQSLRMGYWSDINDTTRSRLGTALAQSLQSGESLNQTVRRVQSALSPQISSRAVAISRTETTGALNAGSMAQIEELEDKGIASGWEWLATLDEHTRTTHWDANGKKSEGGIVMVGGHPARYPGDPDLPPEERVNCRCTSIAILGGKRTIVPTHKSLTKDHSVLAQFPENADVFERLERRFLVDEPTSVLEQLKAHGTTRDYTVTTLYLDQHCPTWSVGSGGKKFRLRQYQDGATFLEEKFKVEGITFKTRKQVQVEEVTNDLVGIGIITYERTEFEHDGQRITVDRNVNINGRQLGKIVVEVKGNLLPDWLQLPDGSEAPWFSKSSTMLRDMPQ